MTVMKSVSAFDAKTHLNELLLRASKGETIQITRRGVPVAKIVPPEEDETPNVRGLVEDIRQLRKGATLGKITAKPRSSSPFEKYRGIGSGSVGSGRKAVVRAIRELRGR